MKILIHIGFHKTGTSFLQKNVFEDSSNNINVISRKDIYEIIINPHDLLFDINIAKSKLNKLLSNKLLNVISHERLSGQPHFGFRDSVILAKRLKGMFPDAKVLIGVREQKSMLLSLHNQYIKAFGTLKIGRYFNNQNLRRDIVFDKNGLKYSALISFYQNLYSTNTVLVLPFEVLRLDPNEYLKRMSDFLDMDLAQTPGIVNPSSTAIEIALWRVLNPLLNKNIPHVEQLFYNPFLAKIIRGGIQSIRFVTPVSMNKRLVDNKKARIEEIVSDTYSQDNLELSRIVGFDLKTLGYS